MRLGDQPLVDFFEQNAFFRKFVAKWFRFSQALGFDVIPNHYYQPIPNLKELEQRDWARPSEAVGVDLNLQGQLDFLRTVVSKHSKNLLFPEAPTGEEFDFHLNNGFYESCDAEFLYFMIQHLSPKRIIELGSGHSTRLMAKALRDSGRAGHTEFVAIEPFPDRNLKNGVPGLTRQIEGKAQDIELEFYEQLEANDILFIDSSHVVKAKNDVVFEYLEILPRLKPGVFVHIHDIFIPSDYPRKWVVDCYKFWSEQYLLQAFLCFNWRFEVIWSASAMSMFHADELERCFPLWKGSYLRLNKNDQVSTATLDGENIWPSSFWIRSKKP